MFSTVFIHNIDYKQYLHLHVFAAVYGDTDGCIADVSLLQLHLLLRSAQEAPSLGLGVC